MTKFSVQHAKQGCALTPASSTYKQLEFSPPPSKISQMGHKYTHQRREGRQIPSTWFAQEPEVCLQVPSYSSIITAVLSLYIQ